MEEVKLTTAKQPQRDVLYARVNNDLYKKVFKLAAETGFSMGDVIRLCVEYALPQVEENLNRVKRGKKA
jgi:hypothetical protein